MYIVYSLNGQVTGDLKSLHVISIFQLNVPSARCWVSRFPALGNIMISNLTEQIIIIIVITHKSLPFIVFYGICGS